jgi:hypothetical protein
LATKFSANLSSGWPFRFWISLCVSKGCATLSVPACRQFDPVLVLLAGLFDSVLLSVLKEKCRTARVRHTQNPFHDNSLYVRRANGVRRQHWF